MTGYGTKTKIKKIKKSKKSNTADSNVGNRRGRGRGR